MRGPTNEELEILAPAIVAFGIPSMSVPHYEWVADFTVYEYATHVWIVMDNPNFVRCQINQKYINLTFSGTVNEVVNFIKNHLKEKEKAIKNEIERLEKYKGINNE
jgi:hypothetical protein